MTDIAIMIMVRAVNCAEVCSGDDGEKTAISKKELVVHAGEELQHALTLADQIDYLGGSPTVKVLPASTSADNKEMLQQDLDEV